MKDLNANDIESRPHHRGFGARDGPERGGELIMPKLAKRIQAGPATATRCWIS